MKICLILEGSYPYVRGGVSTWVDGLIRSLSEHEFVLWAITDLEDRQGQFQYDLPENVVQIRENSLGSSFNLRIADNPNIKFTESERLAISQLIRCGNPDWRVLLNSFYMEPNKPVEFFLSEEFFGILKDFCYEQYPYAGFKDLFWTIRSMFLPLFYLIGQPIPEADLYHSPSTGYGGVLGALGAMKYNKPYVLTEHGIYTREREEELLRSDWVVTYFKELWISMFYMFARFAYQQAQRVTSLYQHASVIQQELGCPPEKCDVIANGLISKKLFSIPDKTENEWIDIAAIVRFAPIKDIKTLIYTFSRLKQNVENSRLHILGGIEDQEYYQECMDLIDFLGVKDIVIPGSVDVTEYLVNMDFTILTSISEGQPFALIESLAAGRPVIATDVGNCRELIEGFDGDNFGHAGICVPPMHQTELLKAMTEMCRSDSQRDIMGSSGKKRIKKFYDHDKMVKNYIKIYDKAIKKWQESDLS